MAGHACAGRRGRGRGQPARKEEAGGAQGPGPRQGRRVGGHHQGQLGQLRKVRGGEAKGHRGEERRDGWGKPRAVQGVQAVGTIVPVHVADQACGGGGRRLRERRHIWWTYLCAPCLATTQKCSRPEAVRTVIEQKVRGETKRSKKFMETRANVVEVFPFASAKKQKHMARGSFITLFAPWAALFRMKAKSMEMSTELVNKHVKLMESIQAAMEENAGTEKIDDLISQADALQAEIVESSRPLAFADKGLEQEKWIEACTYFDEWAHYSRHEAPADPDP